MKNALHISLKTGERLVLNGAVFRVDRRVRLELLNEATFLLEHHIMKPEDATTPLRRLYLAVQTLLIEPASSSEQRGLARQMLIELERAIEDETMLCGLADIGRRLEEMRPFAALKAIRGLLQVESSLMAADGLEIK